MLDPTLPVMNMVKKNEEGPGTSVHISNKSHKSRKDMDKDIVVDMISKGWFRGIHTIARVKQMAKVWIVERRRSFALNRSIQKVT